MAFEDDSKETSITSSRTHTDNGFWFYREWGDLRISNGFFRDGGDNGTLYTFGKSNGGLPLRIEHKDIVNVGERVIFDGAMLRSDVFPAMGRVIGYDYLNLQWYNPTTLREGDGDGTNRFVRASHTGWRLEGNTASPNGKCGADSIEDCDSQWRFKQKTQ